MVIITFLCYVYSEYIFRFDEQISVPIEIVILSVEMKHLSNMCTFNVKLMVLDLTYTMFNFQQFMKKKLLT